MTLFIGLINAGLTVVTLADGQCYSNATINSDLSKLMLSLVMMPSHEGSLTKSHRLKTAWEAKRKGRIGMNPQRVLSQLVATRAGSPPVCASAPTSRTHPVDLQDEHRGPGRNAHCP
jgi:hypothetical protein